MATMAITTPAGATTPLPTAGQQPAPPLRPRPDIFTAPSGPAPGWLSGGDMATALTAAVTPAADTTLRRIAGQQPAPPTRPRRATITPPFGPVLRWLSGAELITSSATLTPVGNTIPLQTVGQQRAPPMRRLDDTITPPSGAAVR